MALNKTTAELKVVETALPERVAQKAGQVILSDDGKFFYDNTAKGRTRINPDGLKLIDTSSVNSNSIVTPLTSMCCNTNYKTLRLETSYNENGWLGMITPESISLNSKYYCYIPKTGEIEDKFWEMLESDNVFIHQDSIVTVNGVVYAAFNIQLIYNGDGTASAAETLSGTLIRYPAPSDQSDSYFNLALRVTDYDDSASNAQAIFESGYAFNTLRVRLRILNTNGAYVTWTGTNIQAIHGSQESADSPITFAAPIQIRNPQTGEIESIQTQEGGYVKFLGFNTVDGALDIFDNGTEGIIQSTETTDYNLVYASFPFEPTWVAANEIGSSGLVLALPLPRKFLLNASTIFFGKEGQLGSEWAYGHITEFIQDCGNFCIVYIEFDNVGELSLPTNATDSEIALVEVEYTISVKSGQALWYHTNEFGVKFVEVITDSVIIDEVDEEDDRPVRSSGIAKYIKHNVTGVYKFKGNITPMTANAWVSNLPDTVNVGYVYNVTDSGYLEAITTVADGVSVSSVSDYFINFRIDINANAFGLDSSSWDSVTVFRSDDTPIFTDTVKGIISQNFDSEGNVISLGFTLTIPYSLLENNTSSEIASSISYVKFTSKTVKVVAGDNIVWNGKGWDKLAGTIDLSSYATKSDVQAVKSDLTRVLRYCGSIYCNENDSAVTTSSLRIGDVYNVYFDSDDGWGTIKLNNSDTEVVISDDGTATFVGTSIETRNGGRSETANYLRMDIAAIKDNTLTRYHWILVPTSDSFSSYTIIEYGSHQPPAAGTYQVTEVSMYVDKQDNGINVVWDGIGFDKLSPAIDMSTYLSKSEIGSVVSSTETMPVSGRAVDAAIKSAVSSVYRYSGTLEYLESLPNSCAIGNVYNVDFTGTIQGTTTEYTNFELDTGSEGSFSVRLPISGLKPGDELEINEIKLRGQSEEYQMLSAYCSNEGYLDITWIVEEDQSAPSNSDSNIIQITSKSIDVKRGDNIVKTALGWDKLAATIDLSSYATIDQLNTVKADISHVFRYKGSVFVYNSREMLNLPEVGDVYNTAYPDVAASFQLNVIPAHGATFTIRDEYDGWWVFSGNDAFYKSFAANVGHDHMGSISDQIELYYECEDLSTGSTIRFRVEDLYDRRVSIDWDYTDADASALVEGATFELSLIITKFKSLKTGDNIVWNGTYMEPLSSHVDLSPYQLKSGVTSKVASGNTNPVQSGAVYDAIQAAVSSVYKPIGSYTVSYLTTFTHSHTSSSIFTVGNVVNLADSGKLIQPFLFNDDDLVCQVVVEALAENDDGTFEVTVSAPSEITSFIDVIGKVYFCSDQFTDFDYVNNDPNWSIVLHNVNADLVNGVSLEEGVSRPLVPSFGDLEVIAGDNVVWTNYGWDKLAGTVDLTGYQPKLEFASEITSENASKPVTAGPVKSYVDSEIAKFLESSGSILNLVGSGQATLLHEYTFAEDTTLAAGAVFYTASLSSPAYKMMIPAVAFPAGVTLLINGGEVEVPLMDSNGAITVGEIVFTIEVLPDGSVTLMTLNSANASLMPIIIGRTTSTQVDTITLAADTAVTIAAGTTFKIFGWPTVQESDTATSINAMLKEIYDTQEAFKAQTSIPDSDNGVDSYTSVADLPTAANSGAVAAVTSDSDTTARGMYMFINGKWQRLAFAGESLVDGDTVEVTIE